MRMLPAPGRRRGSLLLPLLLAPLLAAAPVRAQTPPSPAPDAAPPLWLRYPAISPDGRTIAFSHRGHLWLVPAAGGRAELLTAGSAHDSSPVWSPDGATVAFASDRHGNFDVFTVPAAGGPVRRLTTHSADEVPTGFSPDGRFVLFSAHRMDARTNVQFPSSRVMPELYRVAVEPGREPEPVLTTPALAARYDRGGRRLVYEDLKGYESLWRKHETFAVAHDVWLCDLATNAHTRLTTFAGEDRDPVWAPDERSVFYLSEQGGTSNVWRLPLDRGPGAAPEPVTRFERNPVRFLSVANTGDLCFGYDGEIYVLPAGSTAAPRKVAVRVGLGDPGTRVENVAMSEGATEMALNPDGKELAFVARGEVFVASTEFGNTKRITDTPTQERSVDFSPDGRRLVFAGESGNSWNLFEANIVRPKEAEPYFYNSTVVDVRPILDNGRENFQPHYSPDGKEVAYLENRTTLRVLTLAGGGQSRVILPGDRNYSYEDGDQWFDWAPDGRSFLVQFKDPARWSNEVGLVDAEGKQQLTNLTLSGYDDLHPRWMQGGRSMIWFSNRDGLHGDDGNGGNPQSDVYAMFFTQKAFDRFKLNKAEFDLVKRAEDEEKKRKDKDKDKTSADEDSARKKPPEPVEIDPRNLEDRTARLTLGSAHLIDAALTLDGEQMIYLAKVGKGYELWQNKLRDKENKRLAEFPAGEHNARGNEPPAQMTLDREGKNAFVLAGGKIAKVKLEDAKSEPVKFRAEMNLDPAAERAYFFEHVWRQVREKFYVTDLHGVDWNAYKGVYARFLPYITDNHDFAEMLSEMLGELNASHTGARYFPPREDGDDTAALGAFFDPAHRGPGLRVEEVLDKGPLVVAGSRLAPGMVIEKIDGVVLAPGMDISPLLNRRAGKPTLLSALDPAKGERFEEVIKPIKLRDQEELLYRRWVKQRREETDRLSGGRVGYVHVRSMDDRSFRDTFSEVLGRQSGKAALVVDTRFNGGGNLHDHLATLLGGRAYLDFVPRGQVIGQEPTDKWNRPSAVLVGESNYSDAHLFPWTYRALGLGKLVGMPVPGTGTAVWWETLPDPSLYFGIPQVGFRDANGQFMERAQVEPDVRVENDPQSVARGQDKQLEAAVKLLLTPAPR